MAAACLLYRGDSTLQLSTNDVWPAAISRFKAGKGKRARGQVVGGRWYAGRFRGNRGMEGSSKACRGGIKSRSSQTGGACY
jgi:hypothetical protein